MARNRNDKKAPNKLAWNEITYVINNLTQKDMDIVDDMDITVDVINNFMTEQVEGGGQFKLSYDYEYGDCPNLSLVFYYDDYPNSGYGVSARGKDFDHCMKILLYKFFEVAKGQLFAVSDAKRSTRYG